MENIDFWNNDEFENSINLALLMCFETKIKKNKGCHPSDRLDERKFYDIREKGIYVPSGSRVIDISGFDLINDSLPSQGLVGFDVSDKNNFHDCDFIAFYIKKASSLGKSWRKLDDGVLFESMNIKYNYGTVQGERFFFTINKIGDICPCNREGQIQNFGSNLKIKHDDAYLKEMSNCAMVSLQYLADRKFCWTITAKESFAKAHLGAMYEEIKSLLYAKSIPMTETGRKRPILHLVESHKRRLKNGIDIDISSFLRGVRIVEFGGTVFTVNPPLSIKNELSQSSQIKYF